MLVYVYHEVMLDIIKKISPFLVLILSKYDAPMNPVVRLPVLNNESDPHSIDTPPILQPHAGVTVNLAALRFNYNHVKTVIGAGRICAAVVKANAYGLGAAPCAVTLLRAGCRHFFVAYLNEALDVKRALLDAVHKESLPLTFGFADNPKSENHVHIYVFNGCIPGQEPTFLSEGIIPVLTCARKIMRWSDLSREHQRLYNNKLPAIIHIDTGLNRTGVRHDEVITAKMCAALDHLNVHIIMSHLASSDDMHSSYNMQQRDIFKQVSDGLIGHLGYRPILSLANSNAIGQLDESYLFDMVRPGSALYGLSPSFSSTRTVLYLWATIYQEKYVKKGESIGYAQSYIAPRDMTLAITAVGYADGVSRRMNDEGRSPYAIIAGHRAPIVGRISMDVLALDVTDIPKDHVYEGARVDFINETITMEQFAAWGKTFTYEAQLALGGRLEKNYVDDDGEVLAF